jgi:hypothetical protein
VIVAGRGIGRALLGSGLLAATVLGGAGGYGIGLVTSAASEAAGRAVPLGSVTPTSSPSSPTTPTVPVTTPKPDKSEPLRADDLHYVTRDFTAEFAVRSQVTVKVPKNWWMTQPPVKKEARFTDPTGKRWIRIEAGFTITRPPAASMTARLAVLNALPPEQDFKILGQEIDPKAHTATLTYTYIYQEKLRYVVVRWAALDASGNVAVEMSSTGLPQDKEAVLDVLEHATASVTRTDSPL